jgi:hypothetical protein
MVGTWIGSFPAWATWFGWSLALVGALITVWAFRGRPSAHPLCRRCRHTVRPGTTLGTACTECGAVFRTPRDLAQRLRHPKIGYIGLFVTAAGALAGLGNEGWRTIGKAVLPRYQVDSTQTLGPATVRVLIPRWSDDLSEDIVEVRIGGSLVYRTSMLHPSAGMATLAAEHPAAPGEESAPQPLFWLRSDTGGSGGYSTTYCFTVADGGAFTPFATLSNGVFEGDHWRQPDVTYRYWLTSGAASPVPTLRARPTEGGLRFLPPTADDAPTADTLAATLRTLADTAADERARDLMLGPTLDGFLDLVYAGRAEDAWTFLRDCWDAGLSRLAANGAVAEFPRSREALESMLMLKMSESPYHAELLRRNNGSIARPDR